MKAHCIEKIVCKYLFAERNVSKDTDLNRQSGSTTENINTSGWQLRERVRGERTDNIESRQHTHTHTHTLAHKYVFIVLCKLPSWQVISTCTSSEQKDRLIKNQPNERPPSKPGSFKCYFQVAVKTIALETAEMSRTSFIPAACGRQLPQTTQLEAVAHTLSISTPAGRQHLHTISPFSHEEKKTNDTSAWQHRNAGRPIESPRSIEPHFHNVTPAIESVAQASYLSFVVFDAESFSVSKYRNETFWMKVCETLRQECVHVCVWCVQVMLERLYLPVEHTKATTPVG